MKKEITFDFDEFKRDGVNPLDVVRDEILEAANSRQDVTLKIEIKGYFPAKKESAEWRPDNNEVIKHG